MWESRQNEKMRFPQTWEIRRGEKCVSHKCGKVARTKIVFPTSVGSLPGEELRFLCAGIALDAVAPAVGGG